MNTFSKRAVSVGSAMVIGVATLGAGVASGTYATWQASASAPVGSISTGDMTLNPGDLVWGEPVADPENNVWRVAGRASVDPKLVGTALEAGLEASLAGELANGITLVATVGDTPITTNNFASIDQLTPENNGTAYPINIQVKINPDEFAPETPLDLGELKLTLTQLGGGWRDSRTYLLANGFPRIPEYPLNPNTNTPEIDVTGDGNPDTLTPEVVPVLPENPDTLTPEIDVVIPPSPNLPECAPIIGPGVPEQVQRYDASRTYQKDEWVVHSVAGKDRLFRAHAPIHPNEGAPGSGQDHWHHNWDELGAVASEVNGCLARSWTITWRYSNGDIVVHNGELWQVRDDFGIPQSVRGRTHVPGQNWGGGEPWVRLESSTSSASESSADQSTSNGADSGPAYEGTEQATRPGAGPEQGTTEDVAPIQNPAREAEDIALPIEAPQGDEGE